MNFDLVKNIMTPDENGDPVETTVTIGHRAVLENGILEANCNLSEKYFKDSVSPKSGPSPPSVVISGDSPSLEGNQYSLLNGIIGLPLV